MTTPACLACAAPLDVSVLDLGMQPLANALITPERATIPDARYPLHARLCESCGLVQVEQVVLPERLFADYPYFSSVSAGWLAHCSAYARDMATRFALDRGARIVEIASNDGYLLRIFRDMGLEVLGIEPAENVARRAQDDGIAVEVAFFGETLARRLAREGRTADLLVAKNVLAHVPDIVDFVRGAAALLKPNGVFTVEFPHLLNLVGEAQFDTIYHEHFTYLSLLALDPLFTRAGLAIFDVASQPTHGGSLRVFAAHRANAPAPSDAVAATIAAERAASLDRAEGYAGFGARASETCAGLRDYLGRARAEGRRVVAYGAAAKGVTLLNSAGVTSQDIAFVVDRNEVKQGRLLPGSRIPVYPVAELIAARPDDILILPWNLRAEIIAELPEVADWGGRFVTAVPRIEVHHAG